MHSQLRVNTTVTEKLSFVVAVIGVLLEAIYVVLRYPFMSSSKLQPSLGREVIRVILRASHDLDRFTVGQLQWVFPSSSTAYENWLAANATAEGVPAQAFTEVIGNEGARLHWVGHQNVKKVLLYYHGGGYVLPLSAFHFKFTSYIRREVKRRSGVDIKIAFLEYKLMPKHTYPSQFRQATLALQHVLDSGVSPADIIICGDSVGGQLVLQILSHLLHPHPSLPRIQTPAVPIAGLLAISPWVIYESNAPTFKQKHYDILQPHTLWVLSRTMRRGTAVNNGMREPDAFWSEPLVAPSQWWCTTGQATRNVLLVYGERELFTEDNAELARKMREGIAGTDAVIDTMEESNGIHIGPLIDATFGHVPGETSIAIAKWVNARLTS